MQDSEFGDPIEYQDANRWEAEFKSWGIFLGLKFSALKVLKSVYPTNPARADLWLGNEILRASNDIGSRNVIR